MIRYVTSMALLSIACTPLLAQPNEVVVGKAYALDSEQLLYVEKHQRLNDQRHQVHYETPAGDTFARKELDYSVSKQAPSFKQTNQWPGELIDVQENDGDIRLRYRATQEGKVFTKRFERNDKLIVDAGFDQYVKQHWSTLTDGQPLEIDYLVPSQTTVVSFSVSQTECLANTSAQAVCFSIAPASWWVSVAVDPLTVAYDPHTHNLLRFTGRGNIANADGDYLGVDIRYQYPESDQGTGE